MADSESITPNFQLSDADLEKLPPSALRPIIRQLLAHSSRRAQRIRELKGQARPELLRAVSEFMSQKLD